MKCYSKLFLVALLSLTAALFTSAAARAGANEPQQKKAAPAADAQEAEETPYDEEEYNKLMAAINEPDINKRGPMLLEFIDKYPKSALMQNANGAYIGLMKECAAQNKFELLEVTAEKWLNRHPGDRDTLAFVALATKELKKYQRCVECYEEIYKMQPSGPLAKEIFLLHQASNNLAKQLTWFETLSKMPEFNDDFRLRFGFVLKYMESKNMPKAAEFAQLTLKSVEAVKQPDAETQKQIPEVQRVCYSVIGSDLMQRDKFGDAIPYFKKAIKAKKYSDDFYNIALCLDNMKEVEEANLYYAATDTLGGDNAAKAKSRLEELYKILHNGQTIGIDKVYKKAKDLIAELG